MERDFVATEGVEEKGGKNRPQCICNQTERAHQAIYTPQKDPAEKVRPDDGYQRQHSPSQHSKKYGKRINNSTLRNGHKDQEGSSTSKQLKGKQVFRLKPFS